MHIVRHDLWSVGGLVTSHIFFFLTWQVFEMMAFEKSLDLLFKDFFLSAFMMQSFSYWNHHFKAIISKPSFQSHHFRAIISNTYTNRNIKGRCTANTDSIVQRFEHCALRQRALALFLSDEGPMLETLDYILSVLAVHRPFYISICISTLPSAVSTENVRSMSRSLLCSTSHAWRTICMLTQLADDRYTRETRSSDNLILSFTSAIYLSVIDCMAY